MDDDLNSSVLSYADDEEDQEWRIYFPTAKLADKPEIEATVTTLKEVLSSLIQLPSLKDSVCS